MVTSTLAEIFPLSHDVASVIPTAEFDGLEPVAEWYELRVTCVSMTSEFGDAFSSPLAGPFSRRHVLSLQG